MRNRTLTVFIIFCLPGIAAFTGCTSGRASDKLREGFVSLFNGKDLTGFKGLVADPIKRAKMSADELRSAQAEANRLMQKNWKVIDGVLVYTGDGFDNLCTQKDYADFELLIDWKIEPGSDSGIYLRGSPQVQIWDPQGRGVGSGGLFNNKNHPDKPLKVADRPAGQWNTFRIIMIGQFVIVYLNDRLVVNTEILENYWQPGEPIYETGPIEFQAHRTPVYFKNIFIRELK